MDYVSGGRDRGRFCPKWKKFAADNELKVWDGSMFKLIKCNREVAKFVVEIYKGGFPKEMKEIVKRNGNFRQGTI